MLPSRRHILISALCVLPVVLPAPAGAQGTRDSDKMLDRSFPSTAGDVKYLLFVPKDYDPTRRYPLVVSLRGSGSTYKSATDGFEQAHPWIQDSIQARVPHFILVPECISGTWGGLAGAPSQGVMAPASRAVLEVIEDLKKRYSLDTNRFILTGFSLGGSGTYHILELKPGYWAAAVPTAAGGDTAKIEAIARTPLWHHQGSTDGSAGRRMTKALEDHGYKVVRMVCDFSIDSPSGWRSAVRNAKPEDIVFKNAKAPVTVDSLRRAIDAGAPYIYSELTGGNHASAWINAAHNPLLARWAFSKARGGHTVALAPRGAATRTKRNGAVLAYGQPIAASAWTTTLLGRRMQPRVPGAGGEPARQAFLLLRNP